MRAQARDIRTARPAPGTQAAIVQAFVLAGARSADTARPLEHLGLNHTPGVRELAARGLLVQTTAGGWFFEPEGYLARRRRSFRLVLGLVAASAVLIAWMLAHAL
jgi:hypothetical protein